jgi:hypothetical protein
MKKQISNEPKMPIDSKKRPTEIGKIAPVKDSKIKGKKN